MFRNVFVAALLFTLAIPLAHADEASKRAKLEQIFIAMKLESLMDNMLVQGMKQGEQIGKTMFGDMPMSPSDRKIMDGYQARMTALMKDTLSWEKLKPAYLDLYASEYTEADVDGMLAFYQSQAGQDMVAKTPELLSGSQQIVMARMQSVQTQLQSLTKDLMDQIAASHKDDKPAK